MEQVLLDDLGRFAGLASEAEGGVRELLFVRAVALQRSGRQLLIVVEVHGRRIYTVLRRPAAAIFRRWRGFPSP
jgi:hypothetical protein